MEGKRGRLGCRGRAQTAGYALRAANSAKPSSPWEKSAELVSEKARKCAAVDRSRERQWGRPGRLYRRNLCRQNRRITPLLPPLSPLLRLFLHRLTSGHNWPRNDRRADPTVRGLRAGQET